MAERIRAWVDGKAEWQPLARSIAYKHLDEGLIDRGILFALLGANRVCACQSCGNLRRHQGELADLGPEVEAEEQERRPPRAEPEAGDDLGEGEDAELLAPRQEVLDLFEFLEFCD